MARPKRMVYDITVGFSNGIVRTFKGITKMEYYDNEDYDDKDDDNKNYNTIAYPQSRYATLCLRTPTKFVNEDYDNEDDEDYEWIEIENPLNFNFYNYGDYRFSSPSKNAFALTDDNCCIIFVEVTISNC